jgi:hypothetical protein
VQTKEFVILHKAHAPTLVGEVLAWYIASDPKDVIWSARAFRLQFEQLLKAYEQTLLREKVTPLGLRLRKQLTDSDITFAPEIEARLENLCSLTCERWQEFVGKMQLLALTTDNKRNAAFLSHVLENYTYLMPHAWLGLLHQKYRFLECYIGDPQKLAFTPDSPMFLDSCWHAWSQSWCSVAGSFDSLLRELLKEEVKE